MTNWPEFTAVGAIGPARFFWMQDYNNKAIPCDEIMLAMSLLYYLDDQGRLDDPYDGLLTILAEVSSSWASILRFLIKLDQIWQKFLKVWNASNTQLNQLLQGTENITAEDSSVGRRERRRARKARWAWMASSG